MRFSGADTPASTPEIRTRAGADRVRARLSWWQIVVTVWAVSLIPLVEPAVFGQPGWNLGALGGLVVVIGGGSFRPDDRLRTLSATDRRRVLQATRTATPTWELDLDRVALGRLRRGARARSRGDLAATLVATAVIAALPVVAAARVQQPLYLLAIAPAVPLLAAVLGGVCRDRPRLARFQAALDAPDDAPPASPDHAPPASPDHASPASPDDVPPDDVPPVPPGAAPAVPSSPERDRAHGTPTAAAD